MLARCPADKRRPAGKLEIRRNRLINDELKWNGGLTDDVIHDQSQWVPVRRPSLATDINDPMRGRSDPIRSDRHADL